MRWGAMCFGCSRIARWRKKVKGTGREMSSCGWSAKLLGCRWPICGSTVSFIGSSLWLSGLDIGTRLCYPQHHTSLHIPNCNGRLQQSDDAIAIAETAYTPKTRQMRSATACVLAVQQPRQAELHSGACAGSLLHWRSTRERIGTDAR